MKKKNKDGEYLFPYEKKPKKMIAIIQRREKCSFDFQI